MQQEDIANQLKYCKEIIKRIKRSTYSSPFKEPVDPIKLGCVDYFDIVKQPMDISTINNKLINEKYESAEEFKEDFKLMVANCFVYNPEETHVHRCGREIDKLFDNLYFAMPMEGKRLKMDASMEECSRLLEEILKTKFRKMTWPFLEPVDSTAVPDYYQVIKNPMDLSTIQKKLLTGQYKKKDEFHNDLDQMLENCFTYNAEGTDVYKCGCELKNIIKNYGVADGEIVMQIDSLRTKINSMEREIDCLQSKLENTRNYSLGERVELAKKIEELEVTMIPTIIRIVQKYKKDIDITQSEVEVDLKSLPNRAIDEIAKIIYGEAKNE